MRVEVTKIRTMKMKVTEVVSEAFLAGELLVSLIFSSKCTHRVKTEVSSHGFRLTSIGPGQRLIYESTPENFWYPWCISAVCRHIALHNSQGQSLLTDL